MKQHGLQPKIYRVLGILAWGFGILVTMGGSISRADITKIPQALSFVSIGIGYLQVRMWWMIPTLAIASGICVLWRRHIGEPWVWETIHLLVDNYRDYVFSDSGSDPLHHHRVTLFRRFRFWQYPSLLKRPFGCAKLIPVERSGHTTQRSGATFAVPDRADDVEGVAGRVWSEFRTKTVSGLPDIYNDPSEAAITEYASKTWTTPRWVRARMAQGLSLSRSFCGIPVRVKGREWGIIMLDSRSPESLQNGNEKFHELMGRFVGKLLERI